MHSLRSHAIRAAALCVAVALLPAQIVAQNATSVAPQPRVPVRDLSAPLAVSRDTFGVVLNVRQLAGGRALVNDPKKHRLVLLDSALRVVRVVLDSTSGADNSYGSRPEPLVPFVGDSSLFVDVPSQTLLLIAPDGTIGRAMSAPNDGGIWTVASTIAGVDDRGRLVYRGIEMRRHKPKPGEAGLSLELPGWGGAPISNADSLPLIRGDLSTRSVDTIAALQNVAAHRTLITTAPNGDETQTTYINPLANGDEWALLSDGTIAIVRGHDYHVEFIASNGTVTSSAKLPFDWRRVTDDDKRRIIDSAAIVAARSDSVRDARLRAATAGGSAAAAAVGRAGGAGDGANGRAPVLHRVTAIVPITEVGDYVPAIRSGAARGDLEGNLWILPTTTAQSRAGELVYDVVNRRGELFERVRLPLGRSIVGFGKGGVVYLMSGDLTRGFLLERTRIREP